MLMPHRIVNNVKYHLLYSVLLVALLFGLLPLAQTIAYAVFGGQIWLIALVLWIFFGAYFAFPEKIRLDRDSAAMRQFRNDTPDGTYDAKADAKAFLHSPEFFSDVFSVLMLGIVLAVIIIAAILAGIVTPAILATVSIVWFLLLIPAGALISVSYGAFHLWFTVLVHRGWDESRLHLSNEKHMEH